MTCDDTIRSVTLLSGNKENSLFIQGIKPGIVGVGAIHDDNAIRRQRHCPAHGDVMGFAIGDGHKARQHAVVVEPYMDFDGSLGGTEFGPGEDRQTQVDGSGIEGIELVLEPKAMTWRQALAVIQQFIEERFVERIGLGLIDTGKCGTSHNGAT